MSEADKTTGAPLITACAWCKRVEVKDLWLDSDAGVRRFAKLFGVASPPSFTHGICPDCFAHLEAIRLRQARRAS